MKISHANNLDVVAVFKLSLFELTLETPSHFKYANIGRYIKCNKCYFNVLIYVKLPLD